METANRETTLGRTHVPYWIAVLGPPLVWFADLTIGYPLVYLACESGAMWPLYALTAIDLLLVAALGWLARRCLREAHLPRGEGRPADSRLFLARMGLLSSALFFLAIVAFAIPRLMLRPCQP
jgi:hypothetical protein